VVPVQAVAEAISAARRLKIIGPSQERDRRPTSDELAQLMTFVPTSANAHIDLGAVVRVLSILPLRLSELCGIGWADLNEERRSAVIRGRKNPDILKRGGSIEEVPLIEFGGVDTYAVIARRPPYMDSPFPYRSNSVSQLFAQACLRLKIDDLHLHDLRGHALSSLLEAEVPIPQVAKISGHKDWKVLAKRYARLKAARVHDAIAAAETRARGT
jgi:integrase